MANASTPRSKVGTLKLLWYSNAPWTGTGYGTQSAQVLRRLKADGHDILVASNYGIAGTSLEWNGIQVLAGGADSYSRDAFIGWYDQYQPDWAITLFDVWVFQPREAYAQMRLASWVPVDSYPIPRDVLTWCQAHYPIAMSKFGLGQLQTNGVAAQYAPHAIETSVFLPHESTFRAQFEIPDNAFLVMINAANKGRPPRKAWAQMIFAFAEFARRHDDAYLFLNTDLLGRFEGVPLVPLLMGAGVPASRVRAVSDSMYKTGQITQAHVSDAYAASDVLLSTSMGEGFGLAVIEAQACGTPVIVTDFTAQTELVGAGWMVGWQPDWHAGQQTTWATPFIGDIIQRLEQAYEAKGDQKLRAQAAEFARQYDADTVYANHWRPILQDMEGRIAAPPPLNRQQRRAAKRKAA